MQLRKRNWAAIGVFFAYATFDLVVRPIWNLNVERLAERAKIDTTLSDTATGGGGLMDAIGNFFAFLPHSFGWGFATAALIFGFWDTIGQLFRRYILRRKLPEPEEPEPDIRAWVGNMIPTFDLEKDGCALLHINLLGVGSTPFRISKVEGRIEFFNGSKRVALPPPTIRLNPTADGPLSAGQIGHLTLAQPIPVAQGNRLYEAFNYPPYAALFFEKLDIVLESEDGKTVKRLKLWDSMRISAGEGQLRAVRTHKLFKNKEEERAFRASMDKVQSLLGRDQ